MRISDWSSDVCSSDLIRSQNVQPTHHLPDRRTVSGRRYHGHPGNPGMVAYDFAAARSRLCARRHQPARECRSEEHTSELQSLMRISYAVFCLKKKKYSILLKKNITNQHKISNNTDKIIIKYT